MKMCVHQLKGDCVKYGSKCTYDVDPNKHPNNLDCKWYRPVFVRVIEVKRRE